MTKTRLISSLIVLAVFLAACAPVEAPTSPTQSASVPSSTFEPTLDASKPAATAPAEAQSPTPLPLATSRGPELHATDPATVSLASGGLQLVEFFRFT